jgi:hypothetical protein
MVFGYLWFTSRKEDAQEKIDTAEAIERNKAYREIADVY